MSRRLRWGFTNASSAQNLPSDSAFEEQQSEILAKRLNTEAGPTPEGRARLPFRLCDNREPEVKEVYASTTMIRDHGMQS